MVSMRDATCVSYAMSTVSSLNAIERLSKLFVPTAPQIPSTTGVVACSNAGGLGPAGGERRLQLVHGRAGEARRGVAPLLHVASVAEPLVVDAEAAGVADAPIDDDDADVRAVLHLVQLPPARRAEHGQCD